MSARSSARRAATMALTLKYRAGESNGLSCAGSIPLGAKFDLRDKELRCDDVARDLDAVVGRLRFAKVTRRALPVPEMGTLVRQREHLRSFRISAIDEHQWCILVDEHESAKLLRIQLPVRVVPHDAIRDDDDPGCVEGIAQCLQRRRPCRHRLRPVRREPESVPNPACDGGNRLVEPSRAVPMKRIGGSPPCTSVSRSQS